MAKYRYGDVNGDGVVDMLDAILILRSVSGLLTLSSDEEKRADVNLNDVITGIDASRVLRHYAGSNLIYDTIDL